MNTATGGAYGIMTGADTPFAVHLGRGALPSHEAGLDCRIRVFQRGAQVCGVARCDTSYGPVVLSAMADARVFGRVLDAANAVRKHLLRQATELPTSSSDTKVRKAAQLREAIARRHPVALAKLASVKQLAASGDKQASAFLALVYSQDAASGAAVYTGAGRLPNVHRAGIAIPSFHVAARPNMAPAMKARVQRALATAVAHIPPSRRKK